MAGVDVALLAVSGTYVMTASRGGRGGPADRAGGRGADALGRAHRQRAGRRGVRQDVDREGGDPGTAAGGPRVRRRDATPLRVGAAVAAAVGFAAPRLRRRLGLPQPVVSALAWQAPLALVLAAPPSKRRAAGIYALQMFAYFAHYEMPADDLDGIQKRTRVRYPILLDRVLGLGQIPTQRLQTALWRPGRTAPHDIGLSALHWLWYFVPHLAVIYVLVKRPDRFGRAAGVVALTFDLGLIVYWAVPTAPPWWASANGDLEPASSG